MLLLPVLDILHGLVVRGVAGRRHEYRPIESKLSADPRPATVGRAFATLGYRRAYVADLNAIAGQPPAWSIYKALCDCGLSLMVDAGVHDAADAGALAAWTDGPARVDAIVAGLETLAGPDALSDCLQTVGAARLVFSLDLRDGQPIAQPGWPAATALETGKLAIDRGVRRLIVLDLARVGLGGGTGTQDVLRELRALSADVELIAGGGVRGQADLDSLQATGCDAALVASALHNGSLRNSI